MDDRLMAQLEEVRRSLEAAKAALPPGFEQTAMDMAKTLQPYLDVWQQQQEAVLQRYGDFGLTKALAGFDFAKVFGSFDASKALAGLDWDRLRPPVDPLDSMSHILGAMPIVPPRQQHDVHVHVHVHVDDVPESDEPGESDAE